MRFMSFLGASFASLLALQPTPAAALGPFCGKGDKSFVGKYSMNGVPEVGSQIVIRKDGSFEFYLAMARTTSMAKAAGRRPTGSVHCFLTMGGAFLQTRRLTRADSRA